MATVRWKIEMREIDSLKEYEKNPRILSEKEYRQLSDSIDRFGFIEKPVVNADNTIIGGHQRVAVLRGKGETEILCWVSDRQLDEKEIEELNVRLNRNNGDWDFDILANLYDVGDLLTWGFDEDELGIGKSEKKKNKEKFIISLEFSDKDTMLDYIQKCEQIAQESAAKMKVRG